MKRASVFAGDWTLAAAEGVCSGPGLEEGEVLDGLSSLANKSLLLIDKSNKEVRFRLLETIRQYGLEKLREGSEEGAVRERHLTYYTKLVEELEQELLGPTQFELLSRLDRELANLRVAIDQALRLELAEPIVKMTTKSLYLYWDLRGYYREALAYLDQALAFPGATGIVRGLATSLAGTFSVQRGDLQRATIYQEEVLALSRAHQNNELRYFAPMGMGILHQNLGNYAEARLYYEEALAASEEIHPFYKSVGLANLGAEILVQGEYQEARSCLEKAEALSRKLGNLWVLVLTLNSLGHLTFIIEDYPAAHHYLEEALAISEEMGFPAGKSRSLAHLGLTFYKEEKLTEAHQYLEGSLGVTSAKGILMNLFVPLGVVGLLSKSWLQTKEAKRAAQLICLCGGMAGWKVLLRQPYGDYYAQVLEIGRAGLDEAAFEAAFSKGQAMSFEEVTQYTRQVLNEIKPPNLPPIEPD